MLTETLLDPAGAPALPPSPRGAADRPASACTHSIRLPLKSELRAMPFRARVEALMACAGHHLEQMDLLEDPDRPEPLTPWDRRQLTGHRSSLRRVLERAAEFGIRIGVVEE
ncbi:hypothetical protein [Methylobacterium soli]|uniref:hypothetical protein n=1 Tax=Methylobacterium soli TaxID=553447 RepID=UPI001EE2826C|nr:hypothetical protein [Methylobacterium soli]GJE46744.1 hypothetical protein AEGHOMDF_5952 [Methylobacterium soli]